MFLLAFFEASIQLFPDGTIILHIALILLMIGLLNRTFFKPINRILDQRERQKGGRGGEAANILKSVAVKEREYEKSLLAARNEGYEFVERERAEAVEARQNRMAEAKAETARMLEDEKRQLKEHVAEARVELVREAREMAEKISSNILKA